MTRRRLAAALAATLLALSFVAVASPASACACGAPTPPDGTSVSVGEERAIAQGISRDRRLRACRHGPVEQGRASLEVARVMLCRESEHAGRPRCTRLMSREKLAQRPRCRVRIAPSLQPSVNQLRLRYQQQEAHQGHRQ